MRADLYLKSENPSNYEKAFNLLLCESVNGNRQASKKLAKMYREGQFVSKNLLVSASILKSIQTNSDNYVLDEEADMLIELKRIDHSLIKRLEDSYYSGDIFASIRLYRIYSSKEYHDLEKALFWIRKILPTGSNWAMHEYYKTLYLIGREDTNAELISLIEMNNADVVLKACRGLLALDGIINMSYEDAITSLKESVNAGVTWVSKYLSKQGV